MVDETAQLLDIADGLLVPDSLLWLTSHRLVAQLEKLGHTLVINSAA